MAEALVVQEFLEKAQGLVEVDIEEEISAAELQERLENLEVHLCPMGVKIVMRQLP